MPDALQLALLLAILLPATKLAASACDRWNIPPIIGELMVGVLLGPGLFNLLGTGLFAGGTASKALLLLAQLGGYVLMFVAGLETDIERMKEATGAAFVVALSGVVWPFFLGTGVSRLFGLSWTASLFMGGALTATSVSISARTLMDAGRMASREATVILGAAVIDDVMGMFVLALLVATVATGQGASFGLAPAITAWLEHALPMAGRFPLLTQLVVISVCVAIFFVVAYGAAQRWLDRLLLAMRRLSATEAIPACVLAMIFLYALGAEWLGSVAGITGAYLLGYVFAGSKYKGDVERSFYAIGHAFLIPLFFVAVGLSSDYRALSGYWMLMWVLLIVAIIGKLFGCGMAAMVSGMDWVRALRVGFGMMSRGEVGLIVAAIAASSGIFKPPEVAVMVAVVMLTTLLTPIALRFAFQLHSPQDAEEARAAGLVAEDEAKSAAGLALHREAVDSVGIGD